jgi:hypothetical protein
MYPFSCQERSRLTLNNADDSCTQTRTLSFQLRNGWICIMREGFAVVLEHSLAFFGAEEAGPEDE